MATKATTLSKPFILKTPRPEVKSTEEYQQLAEAEYKKHVNTPERMEEQLAELADENGMVEFLLVKTAWNTPRRIEDPVGQAVNLVTPKEYWQRDTVKRVASLLWYSYKTSNYRVFVKPNDRAQSSLVDGLITEANFDAEAAKERYTADFVYRHKSAASAALKKYDSAKRAYEKSLLDATPDELLTEQQRKDKLVHLAAQLGVQIKLPEAEPSSD